MMNTVITTEFKKECILCGSFDVWHEELQFDSEYINHSVHCNACGEDFTMVFKFDHSEHIEVDESVFYDVKFTYYIRELMDGEDANFSLTVEAKNMQDIVDKVGFYIDTYNQQATTTWDVIHMAVISYQETKHIVNRLSSAKRICDEITAKCHPRIIQ